jgi:hypothetical protein
MMALHTEFCFARCNCDNCHVCWVSQISPFSWVSLCWASLCWMSWRPATASGTGREKDENKLNFIKFEIISFVYLWKCEAFHAFRAKINCPKDIYPTYCFVDTTMSLSSSQQPMRLFHPVNKLLVSKFIFKFENETIGSTKCELAKCESAKCELAKCEMAICELAKCELAKCESAKCELAQSELAQCESANVSQPNVSQPNVSRPNVIWPNASQPKVVEPLTVPYFSVFTKAEAANKLACLSLPVFSRLTRLAEARGKHLMETQSLVAL